MDRVLGAEVHEPLPLSSRVCPKQGSVHRAGCARGEVTVKSVALESHKQTASSPAWKESSQNGDPWVQSGRGHCEAARKRVSKRWVRLG